MKTKIRKEIFEGVSFFDSLSSYPPSATAWPIDRLIKMGARVSYQARRWYVHIASAFPLAHHYRVVLTWGS
jgi:hypothetical protein